MSLQSCIPTVHPVPLGTNGRTWDVLSVLSSHCIPTVHPVPLGTDGQTWDVPSVLPTLCVPTVHPVPLYHWERMDGHGMSLQSYPHSVTPLSIPSQCPTRNGWTNMGCTFSPTHTRVPIVHPVPLGTDGQTWDVPSVLPTLSNPTVHPIPLYHWEWMDGHGISCQSYLHQCSPQSELKAQGSAYFIAYFGWSVCPHQSHWLHPNRAS